MSAKVIVQNWITEHTNGKRKSDTSPTGWERRTGQKVESFEPQFAMRYRKSEGGRVLVNTGVYERKMVDEWAPCDPPRRFKYEDHDGGGIVTTEVIYPDWKDVENAPQFDDLTSDEWHTIVEALLARRRLLEMRVGNGGAEERERVHGEIKAERIPLDTMLSNLGVDVTTVQRYDRY